MSMFIPNTPYYIFLRTNKTAIYKMDFIYLLKIIGKRKWLILFLVGLTTALTYFLMKQQSVVYESSALVATGIVDHYDPTEGNNISKYIQPYRVENSFSTLIENMKARKSMNFLIRNLLLHDLKSAIPFRDMTEVKERYEEAEIDRVITNLEEGIINNADTTLVNIQRLLKYDFETLRKQIDVKRLGNTDYLQVKTKSENPDLAALIINTFCQEFIDYYTTSKSKRSTNSIIFFKSLAEQKKADLDAKNEQLKQYKLDNNVVNLDEQTKTTLDQIRLLEISREEENKKIPAFKQALINLERYTDENLAAFAKQQWINKSTVDLKAKIQTLNNEYITGGKKDKVLAQQIEVLRKELRQQVKAGANNRTSTQGGKKLAESAEELVIKRIDTEINLEIAKEGVKSLDKELNRLRERVTSFVSKEATISALEREIAVDTDEYLDIVAKANSAEFTSIGLDANLLRVVEPAIPAHAPEPSSAPFAAILAGIIIGTLTVLALVILTFLDHTLSTPDKFKHFTGLPLLSFLNYINVKKLDLEQLFLHKQKNKRMEAFKQLLRKLRFEIEAANAKSFLVTSPKDREGKTFFIITLAYTLSLSNKKVLLIDTNFKNNTLSQMPLQPQEALSNVHDLMENNHLLQQQRLDEIFPITGRIFNHKTGGAVDVLQSNKSTLSPSELLGHTDFQRIIKALGRRYDYIFLEAASINEYADAKELNNYVDKVIAIFAAQSTIYKPDKNSIAYLKTLGDKFVGSILNKIDLNNVKS